MKIILENKIFVIHHKGEMIGASKAQCNLPGWRPAKKVYFTLGAARSGARYLPKEILDDCEIVEYGQKKVVEKLSLAKKQKAEINLELKRLNRSITAIKETMNLYLEMKNFGMEEEANQRLKQYFEKKRVLEARLQELTIA